MSITTRKIEGIEPLRFHSLSELTARNLRESIIYGSIKPGTRLTETELAESLGASRNVIREAVMMLLSEGLMVKERNKYTKVIDFTEEDIEDIFDLRIAIEKSALKRCLDDKYFCDKLEMHSDKIEGIMAEKEQDYRKLMYADMELHNYIIAASGNKRLQDTWNHIHGPMMMLLFLHLNEMQAMKSSHKSLIDTFRGGNYEEACEAIEKHIEDSKTRLLQCYTSCNEG